MIRTVYLDRAAQSPIPLIGMGGQSNSAGRAAVSSLPPYLQGQIANVLTFTGQQLVQYNVANPNGNQGGLLESDRYEHGPDPSMMWLAQKSLNSTVALFKWCLGNRPLTLQGSALNPEQSAWDPEQRSLSFHMERAWDAMMADVATRYKQGVQVLYWYWCQGENDGEAMLADRTIYNPALSRYIAQVRKLSGNPNLPFIITLPWKYDPSWNGPIYAQIDHAIDNPGVIVTTVDMLSTYGDGVDPATILLDAVHYSSAVYVAEGIKAFELYQAHISGQPTPTTPANLTLSNQTANSADLTWSGSSTGEFILRRNGYTVGYTSGNSYSFPELVSGDVLEVVARNAIWQVAKAEITF